MFQLILQRADAFNGCFMLKGYPVNAFLLLLRNVKFVHAVNHSLLFLHVLFQAAHPFLKGCKHCCYFSNSVGEVIVTRRIFSCCRILPLTDADFALE